ncbi:MAG: Ig-like domain-containing protein [Candidatus Peregrinibacteria bacterium]|nr:Ig-like domain-containing protein [Candidatus Peregrinibacteria bacterium]
MKNLFKKITNISLALIIATVAVSSVYYFQKNHQESLLSAGVLDGILPADVNAVEFVSPKGTSYPINGVVTISSVFVETTSGEGNVSGSDLENSFIVFTLDGTEPTGTVIVGNQIVIAEPFTTAFTVDAGVPGDLNKSITPLTIAPVQCSALQLSLIQGQGSGFENVDPADLPTPSSTFPNALFEVDDILDSIILSYPVSTGVPAGAKTFQILIRFVPDITIDPVSGIAERAKIVANNGIGDYEIWVQKGVAGDDIGTAANFIYVFNDLLGVNSPFIARYDPNNSDETVFLESRELGEHTNDYKCMVDGVEATPCFSGGSAGSLVTGQKTGSVSFDFDDYVGDPNFELTQFAIGNLTAVGSTPGSKEFAVYFNFDDLNAPPDMNGCNMDDPSPVTCNIDIHENSDAIDTAFWIDFAVNNILNSAFKSSVSGSVVTFTSTEQGDYVNDYVCVAENESVANCAPLTEPNCALTNACIWDAGSCVNVSPVQIPFQNCFQGASSGEAIDVLSTPMTLDNELTQGETALVYASGSSGELEWISSHPSVFEVQTLSEASDQGDAAVQFVSAVSSVANDNVDEQQGAYNIVSCDEEFDPDTNDITSQSCEVEVTLPITFDITGETYEAIVTVNGENVSVPLTGSTLNGLLTANGTYTMGVGASFAFSGTVEGVVSGSISGQYSGSVTGTVTANVTAGEILGNQGELTDIQTQIANQIDLNVGEVSIAILKEVPDTFTTTVKLEEGDISQFALITAKRPGESLLTAIDKMSCIASMPIEVVEQKVILEMVGRDPGDVLDTGDTVQINAFVGAANGEMDEYQNITASSGIEWFSSNEGVATIDGTGLLTALKPGVTNITARYDTGEAEIGTIESVPLQVTVNKISGIRITYDQMTEDKLPSAVVDNAYKSVMIAIHNPEAAGHTLIIEGQQVAIELPAGEYKSDIEKMEAIGYDLETKLAALDASDADLLLTVTTIPDLPGMLILQPLEQADDHDGDKVVDIDENGIVDVSTSALEEDLTILPTYSNTVLLLPSSETYGLQVIVEYDNGATKLMNPTEFSWVNTPVNYLEQAALDSGLLKFGEISGTSTVVAKYENADGSIVQSNYLTVKVDSGPVLEFLRRIGSGSVTKGSRINMLAKIVDVDTIADIAYISSSFVYSNYSTYAQINQDSQAVWYTAIPFLDEVTVVEQSDPAPTEGEGETTESTVEPEVLQYKVYDIPIEVPVDANMFDGVYKLVLSISDTDNHTLNYVYPIRIGEIGEGDVNGDGATNMVDVIIAFQIATGLLPVPTPAQLEAANVDGMGGVTMIDVILLFNKVTS